MKEYLKSKKTITLFILTSFLFAGVGISAAQSEISPTRVTPTAVNTDTYATGENNIDTTKDETTLNEELNTVEDSIKKTESVLNTIDRKESENILKEQSQELLKILKERDISSIETEKEKRLKGARSFLKNKTEKDNLMEKEKEDITDKEINTKDGQKDDKKNDAKDTTENDLKSLDSELQQAEKDIAGIKKTEIEAVKEVKRLDSVVFDKKRKILERVRVKKDTEEALLDSDNDGISNFDEINIYKTDPFSSDSDGDGYIDGAEILSGFNPKDPSLKSVIKYEDPKKRGKVEKGLFAVSSIESIKIDSKKTDSQSPAKTKDEISIKGKSIPNAFITLYIYSDPIVVTVKTDKDGNWNYTLDKELKNGDHEIYVAITDNNGSIIAKSNPIPFVKQAEAITVDKSLLSLNIDTKPGFFSVGYIYAAILLIVFFTGIIFVIVGLRARAIEIRNN